MTAHKPKVLFLSTGNATRSLIAEGFLRTLAAGRFDITSVGAEPSALNDLASEVMKEVGIDISGQKPKSVAQWLKERFRYVIAICDTAEERSPVFPFSLRVRHWSIVDPNTSEGLPELRTEAYRHVRDELKNQVCQFIADTAQMEPTELAIA